jgi:RimJ/RimL family protein N-acetyltransferase
MIAFRELQRSDLSFLIEVRNACREMLHDNKEFGLSQAQKWFEATRPRFYIITVQGEPAGYFRTSNWDNVNRRVNVGCDLRADYRGRGLARAAYPIFLRFLFEDCNMNKVSLDVLEHNDRARRLYHDLGFVTEGVRRQEIRRDDGYLDSVLMSMLSSEFNLRYGSGEKSA